MRRTWMWVLLLLVLLGGLVGVGSLARAQGPGPSVHQTGAVPPVQGEKPLPTGGEGQRLSAFPAPSSGEGDRSGGHSVGAPPVGLAPNGARPEMVRPLNPGSLAYSTETVNSLFARYDVDVPEILNTISSPTWDYIWTGDFVGTDFSRTWNIRDDNTLVTMDTATGAQTIIGAVPAPPGFPDDIYTGMAYDPTTGNMYASSCDLLLYASWLYLVDLVTPNTTLIGQITNAPCIIAIAADDSGQLWGYDIVNDNWVSIDKSTGAGTVIGYIGFDANYGQGMDWDSASGQMYMAAFNNLTFQAELRTVNLSTGVTTLVGVLGQTIPGGLVQLGWTAIAGTTYVPPSDLTQSYKQATLKMEEGGGIDYEIGILNSGRVTATQVLMTDTVPAAIYQGDLSCQGGVNGTWGYDNANEWVWWAGEVGLRDGRNLVNDPDFENGPPPTSGWDEWITPSVRLAGCTEWIVDPLSAWGIPAHSGAYAFWAGGYCFDGVQSWTNTNRISQSVAIPAGCNAELTFFANHYRPDMDDPPAQDWFYVEVSTDEVFWNRFFQKELAQANDSYPYWVEEGPFDLSAYDGQVVYLRFGGESDGQYTGNTLVDDVRINCGDAYVDKVVCTYSARPDQPCGIPLVNQAVISYSAHPDVVVTATTEVVGKVYYASDFEADDGGFSTVPPEWEWGLSGVEVVRAHSGDNAWGVDLDANYENNANYLLTRAVDTGSMPPMAPCVSPTLWLQWWEWYSTESGWDYINLYVNGNLEYSASGSSGGWVHRQVDITPYLGGLVNIEFRFTSDSSVRDYLGWYIDDVAVHLGCYGVDQDMALVTPGTCHMQPHTIWLGSGVDDEAAPGSDPENDGLTADFRVPWVPGNVVGVTVTVNGGSGFVKVWFDWNRNGIFEAGEDSVDPPAAPGDNYYTFTVPMGFDPFIAPLDVRSRLYTSDPGPGAPPGGTVTDGEVEDTQIVHPTAVRLTRLEARPRGPQVVVLWETAGEVDNLGFHLYRSLSPDTLGERLNEALIPSRSPGEGRGAAYEFLDETARSGTTYYYTVEDVDVNGLRRPHGPVALSLWRVHLPLIFR